MNHYFTSSGERVSQSQIDQRIRKAKAKKLQLFLEENNYIFCEVCNKNDCKPVDCSHDLAVYDCKKQGCIEKAWDVDNITLRGRRCHQIKDGLNIHKNKIV